MLRLGSGLERHKGYKIFEKLERLLLCGAKGISYKGSSSTEMKI